MLNPTAQVRMKDIAERAGVSISTVSHVINQPQVVKAETIARVRQVMDEFRFIPNAAARQLKVGDSDMLAMVVSDIAEPFWADLVRAVEARAEELGLSVLLADSNFSASREATHLEFFESQRVKGILLAPVDFDLVRLTRLTRRHTPLVLFGQAPSGVPCPSASHDDLVGGRLAVQHLASLGRRRLAFVGGPLSLWPVANRLQGASEAAQDERVDLSILATRDLSFEEGHRVGLELLSGDPALMPDGVLGATDLVALGLLKALCRDGDVRIPQDIAVIGYGDVRLAVPLGALAGTAGIDSWLAAWLAGSLVGLIWGVAVRRRRPAPGTTSGFAYGPALWTGPYVALLWLALV